MPILILHGTQDSRTTVRSVERFEESIRQAGGDVELRVFPDAGHVIRLASMRPVVDAFLARTLWRP
jgi:dipeptidyl aminopeptidase/acylaminoacyl peptidase